MVTSDPLLSKTTTNEWLKFNFNLVGPSPISPDISNDFLIAKELSKAEEEQLKLDQQKEFELLQVIFFSGKLVLR